MSRQSEPRRREIFGPEWLARYSRPDVPGEIVTFYSYKGGTGRTMAVANCAGLLAEYWPDKAKPILLIDFDLEAAGLHQYLRPHLPPAHKLQDKPGTLELFQALHHLIKVKLAAQQAADHTRTTLDEETCHTMLAEFDFTPYLIQTRLNSVFMIKAGCFDASYAGRLGNMNWQGLYALAPSLFRALAARWATDYATTLIDARTGLSDTGSLCTMLLPDVLVVVFTPNWQSLDGIDHIVREAKSYRAKSVDLRPLRVYPLPSRVEQTSEDYRQAWRYGKANHQVFGDIDGYQPMFEKLFNEVFADVVMPHDLHDGLDIYFDEVQVPHSPDYAFGERLCFGEQGAKDRLALRGAYEVFLPWLSSAAQPWQEPDRCLLRIQRENWLAKLLPVPTSESEFARWLDTLHDACYEMEGADLARVTDANEMVVQPLRPDTDSGPDAVLPAMIMLQALMWMQDREWDDAIGLLYAMEQNAQKYGLSASWSQVPQHWLNYMCHSDSAFTKTWLASDCVKALHNWLIHAQIDRAARWAWCDQIASATSQFGIFTHVQQTWAQDLFEERQTVLGATHPDTVRSQEWLAKIAEALLLSPETQTSAGMSIVEKIQRAYTKVVQGVKNPFDFGNGASQLAPTRPHPSAINTLGNAKPTPENQVPLRARKFVYASSSRQPGRKAKMRIMLLGAAGVGKTYFLGSLFTLSTHDLAAQGFHLAPADIKTGGDMRAIYEAVCSGRDVPSTPSLMSAELQLRRGIEECLNIEITEIIGQTIQPIGSSGKASYMLGLEKYDGIIIIIKAPNNEEEKMEASDQLARCMDFLSILLRYNTVLPVTLVLNKIDQLQGSQFLKPRIDEVIARALANEETNLRAHLRLIGNKSGDLIAPLMTPILYTKYNYELIDQFFTFLRRNSVLIPNKVFPCSSIGFDYNPGTAMRPYGTGAAFLWTVYAALKTQQQLQVLAPLADQELLIDRLLEDITEQFRAGRAYFDNESPDKIWQLRNVPHLFGNEIWDESLAWDIDEKKQTIAPLPMQGAPRNQDEYIARSGHLMHKLKAKDSTGRWAYYFVLVEADLEAAFMQAIAGDGTTDLEHYGKVVASCYGEEPTQEVKDLLKEKYGFAV